MKKYFFIIALVLINYINAQSGTFIDTVYYFKPGIGQNLGQSSEYFPKNIFGPPSSNARWNVPESRPEELCSIGLNGEIVVGLKNGIIKNGEGVDFIIFENAFERLIDNKIFAEPALISVSQDGVNFFTFPYNEWTLDGMAGKTPTNGQVNPFDYPACGGDGFDLSVLGLDFITHIKIKDVSLIVSINETHPYYQPQFLVSGFDLDAVAIKYPSYTSVNNYLQKIEILENSENFLVKTYNKVKITIYNLNGFLIKEIESFGNIYINKKDLPQGMIIFIINDEIENNFLIEKKINLY